MNNNTITFFYNNMTMIMLHLEKSVGLLADFENWSKSEDEQISLLKETALKENLKTTLFILSSREMNYGLWNSKNIIKKAELNKIDYVVFYQLNPMINTMDDLDLYQNISGFLNIKKMIVANNFLLKEASKFSTSFVKKCWKENAIIIEVKKTKDLEDNLILLKESKFKEFEKENNLNYEFTGRVSEGKKRGRTIGFPTINLITEEFIALSYGVYACDVYVESLDKHFLGSGCYWKNEMQQDVFEIFLIDFDKEIYGWKVEVRLIEKLRENIKVNGFDELKELLKKDLANTLKFKKHIK
ncbi:riboflavin kinase [Spiroplasma cantharicola]|uniref:riboflavin kinase n=1 Tax=Spiroplasma cantharicola TaxID=362837 RepID=A0A0M5KCB2_9MOLU|nr:riboflavin kinase [Spiroplasma cantharicola]ALD66426.1 riboflavin kinase/FAD synthetase [Spiroplasma cantharicola]